VATGSIEGRRRAARLTRQIMGTAFAAVAFVVAACGAGQTAAPSVAAQPGAATPQASAAPGASSSLAPAGSRDLILATTTSTQDSGLLDVLVPAFQTATGYTVKTVAVGSGQALKMGEEGNADVILVHSPAAEKAFMDSGFGVDRRLVAHNYFLVVGPSVDPAGIKGLTKAADAFSKIAATGATFVSRGDGSGTETKELAIWKTAGITPKGQPWYLASGQGMAPTLQIASEKGGYTLTDNATFIANGSKLSLESLVQGDPTLLNIYHVIEVNPAKWPKVNAAGAKAFADFITSAAGQAIISDFGTAKYGQPLFVADAGKAEGDVH
jgi:tungstate transport system substrate-binding protein